MEKTTRQRWATILFLGATGLLFIAGVFLIGTSFQEDRLQVRDNAGIDRRESNIASVDGGKIMLRNGKEAYLGNSKIIYRGLDDDRLTFDLFILELDPHYAYERKISLKTARKGFRLGGQDFRLLTARKSTVKLELIN